MGRASCEDLRVLDGSPGLPERIHLLECRLRVRGERRHFRGPNFGWVVDTKALWRVVEAGVEWCVRNGSGLPLTLKVRTLPARVVRRGQELHSSIRQGLEASTEVGVVRVTSATPESFRTMVVEPSRGRVSLIGGGAPVETDWEATRDELRAMMQTTADSTVYGFLKRGSYRPAAESGYSLSQDWPQAEHHDPATQLGQAFEAEYAPDAFGAQLLGAGYAGRTPQGSDWTYTALGDDRVIVEHRDPATWYARPMVALGRHANYMQPPHLPVPHVLAQARRDFAAILFRDEIAWERGHA
jgi:hypothetical protein